MASSSSESRGGVWPYPGDGFDEALWHRYDALMAVLYGLLFLLDAGTLARVLRAGFARAVQRQNGVSARKEGGGSAPEGARGDSVVALVWAGLSTTTRLRVLFYNMIALQTLCTWPPFAPPAPSNPLRRAGSARRLLLARVQLEDRAAGRPAREAAGRVDCAVPPASARTA
jgi:hypothetical protein